MRTVTKKLLDRWVLVTFKIILQYDSSNNHLTGFYESNQHGWENIIATEVNQEEKLNVYKSKRNMEPLNIIYPGLLFSISIWNKQQKALLKKNIF